MTSTSSSAGTPRRTSPACSYGDPNQLATLFRHSERNAADIHLWFDPAIAYTAPGEVPASFTGFEGRSAMQPAGYPRRVFPTQFDLPRNDGIRNWDVKVQRRFQIWERLAAVVSVDALNATNHTNFSGPNTDPTSRNFGSVTSQRGLSRVFQFNLRLEF